MVKIDETTPWVEKYRPKEFEAIVLDKYNKKIMQNIIDKNIFPNLLFYGPPGTGKTTTIINLINTYQNKYNQDNKGLMIHLNASDERGIDIIRNQIYTFVNSKGLFNNGSKFIILDEVDYMTKNAQQALKNLIQTYNTNVRFCLICNYVSKIDESLGNEFMKLKFNQLPKSDIINFLNIINESENINLSIEDLESIQKLYNSDIRSMINYMQSNQNNNIKHNIISNNIWKTLTQLFTVNYDKHEDEISHINNNLTNILIYIDNISINHNICKKNIIKNHFDYIIQHEEQFITKDLLKLIEFVLHIPNIDVTTMINYYARRLLSIIYKLSLSS